MRTTHATVGRRLEFATLRHTFKARLPYKMVTETIEWRHCHCHHYAHLLRACDAERDTL